MILASHHSMRLISRSITFLFDMQNPSSILIYPNIRIRNSPPLLCHKSPDHFSSCCISQTWSIGFLKIRWRYPCLQTQSLTLLFQVTSLCSDVQVLIIVYSCSVLNAFMKYLLFDHNQYQDVHYSILINHHTIHSSYNDVVVMSSYYHQCRKVFRAHEILYPLHALFQFIGVIIWSS